MRSSISGLTPCKTRAWKVEMSASMSVQPILAQNAESIPAYLEALSCKPCAMPRGTPYLLCISINDTSWTRSVRIKATQNLLHILSCSYWVDLVVVMSVLDFIPYPLACAVKYALLTPTFSKMLVFRDCRQCGIGVSSSRLKEHEKKNSYR